MSATVVWSKLFNRSVKIIIETVRVWNILKNCHTHGLSLCLFLCSRTTPILNLSHYAFHYNDSTTLDFHANPDLHSSPPSEPREGFCNYFTLSNLPAHRNSEMIGIFQAGENEGINESNKFRIKNSKGTMQPGAPCNYTTISYLPRYLAFWIISFRNIH